MAPNQRVAKAFRAMRAIGILEEKVKPVLKDLLKLYDKNWELIEEENYRALADAILERDEMEAATEKNKKLVNSNDDENSEREIQLHDEADRPLKRLRLKHQDNHVSSSLANCSPGVGVGELKKPKVEENEVSAQEITNPEPHSVPLQPLARDKGKQPVSNESGGPVISVPSHSSIMRSKDKGKEPLLSQSPPKDFKFSERSSHGVSIREPKADAVISHLPKQVPNGYVVTELNDNPSTEEKLHADVAATAVHPEPSPQGYFSVENASVRDPAVQKVPSSQSVIENDESIGIPDFATEKRIISELVKSPSKSNPNIAPAPCEDVSVSVSNCSTLGKPEVQYALQPLEGADNVQSNAAGVLPHIPRSLPPCSGMSNLPHDNRIGNHYNVDSERALTAHNSTAHNSTDCQSAMTVKPRSMLNNVNSAHDVIDLAKGQEQVVVLLLNEINSECRPSFNYIPENVIFQKAHVNISLAHIRESCCAKCSGDCLSSSSPCACSNETNGEYAYTLEGLVKEKLLEECISMKREHQKQKLLVCKECPLERLKTERKLELCKGHLMRKFIKECWWKCGCSKNCGNRVVQRGIDRKLQVFMTVGGKGWGLRTLESLPKGAFVCEYVGEVITNSELCDRVLQNRDTGSHQYSVLLDANWSTKTVLKDEEALCLDAAYFGNVARFINHRCADSNLIEIPVEMETPDHHYYHLAFFTTREVKALEELTWDYGINFDDHEHSINTFKCLCGSNFCRNITRTTRSASETAT